MVWSKQWQQRLGKWWALPSPAEWPCNRSHQIQWRCSSCDTHIQGGVSFLHIYRETQLSPKRCCGIQKISTAERSVRHVQSLIFLTNKLHNNKHRGFIAENGSHKFFSWRLWEILRSLYYINLISVLGRADYCTNKWAVTAIQPLLM